MGQFVGVDGGHPGGEALQGAGAVGEHRGEGGHVPGRGGQRIRASQDLLELCLVAGVEPVGVRADPLGDLPDRGRRRRRGEVGAGRAEGVQVAADGLRAAAVAQGDDLFGEAGSVMAALVPAVVQVVGVAVQR